MPDLEDVRHCGCDLPRGWWGSDGWHWARTDPEMLYNLEKRRFSQERERRGVPEEGIAKEWAAWLELETAAGRMVNGVHEMWRPAIGLPFAMQRCEPYMKKWRAAQEIRRKKTAKEKRSAKLLGEEPE